MIFIEFNGLPGCGKTTLSNDLTRRLANDGYVVSLYEDIHLKAPLNPLRFLTYVLNEWEPGEMWKLFHLSGCVESVSLRTQLKRIAIAEHICFNYRTLQKQKGFCIVDQGIVQALTSIAFTYRIHNESGFTELSKDLLQAYIGRLLCVNCNTTPEIARHRIRYRNISGGSRFNHMDDDAELETMLSRHIRSIELVRNSFQKVGLKYIDIDMACPVNENSSILKRFIKENGELQQSGKQDFE